MTYAAKTAHCDDCGKRVPESLLEPYPVQFVGMLEMCPECVKKQDAKNYPGDEDEA